MRHQRKGHKIGRDAAHRKATLAAMSISLIEHKRITTTYPKAKALRVYVEPLIHRAKEDSQHNRRQVFKHLQNNSTINELFSEIGGKIADRPGGYTRIIKLGRRKGDGAEIAVIELVDYNDVKPDGSSTRKKSSTRRSRRKKGSGAAAGAAAATAAVAAEAVSDDAAVAEEIVEAPVEAAEVVEEVAEAPAETAEVVEEIAEAPVEAAEVVEEVAEAPVEAAEVVEEVAEAPVEAAEVVEEVAEAPVEAAEIVEEEVEAPAEAAAPAERLQIESLEGIGPAFGQRFRGLDIEYVDQLLDKASSAEGRASLVESTSFTAEKIQAWATAADLFRVEGVNADFAELLQASGVNSVQDLGSQDAGALVSKMAEVNDSGEKKLAPDGPPSEEEASKWIAQAKGLESKLSI